MSFSDVSTFYRTGEEIVLEDLPPGTARVVARRATGDFTEATVGRVARLENLVNGTHALEAVSADGQVLAEELTTVGGHPGERPVLGFATSFDEASVAPVLKWLKALRCTVVQVYDWMASYSEPLGPQTGWTDPLGRPVSYRALRSLVAGIRATGAVAQAYAPVCASNTTFAASHPDLLLYRGDGDPEHLGDLLTIADPANREWQRHWSAVYGEAADKIGFDGFHLDTYGYPRAALDASGATVDMRLAYSSFLRAVRAARPAELLSFNQVNGVPPRFELPTGRVFRYVETWPPNNAWRHLEALLDRSNPSPGAPGGRGAIACYPPVWEGDRAASLRTVTYTEAIATCLGASLLVFGDLNGVLQDPYYPRYERLVTDEAATVLRWRRFALRCRDLFLEGEDTSWCEIGDENGSVVLVAAASVHPEPLGQALFARVVRQDGLIAVGVVDLTGSANGQWSQPTAEGRCRSVRVQVLLEHPEEWSASAAVLGASGDRFTSLTTSVVGHREGRALEVSLPLVAGWSVLRLVSDKGLHRR